MEPRPIPGNPLNISTSTIIRFFLVALVIFGLYYMMDVVLVVLAAIVIASALEPLIRKLTKFKIPRIFSALIVYTIVAFLIFAILVFFVPKVVSDVVAVFREVPREISFDDLWSPIRDIGVTFGSQSLAGRSISLADFVVGLQNLFAGTGAGAFQTLSTIFGGVLSLILTVVLSFYLAVRNSGVDDFLKIVTPIKYHEYIINLWRRAQRKIGYWLQGQVVLGLLVGLLVYISLSLIGMPHALLLAVLAAMLEIIPIFGPIIAAVPAVLISFAGGGLGTSTVVIIVYLAIHQLENHVLYPMVTKKIVGVSPIVVILALIIGAKLAGILGALIAVPLSTAIMEYVDDVEKKRAGNS